MVKQSIVLAADHAGYKLKSMLADEIVVLGFSVIDLGTNSTKSVDYPDFGHAAALSILNGKGFLGIICCGSGIGIAMAANRHPGIRAAVCHNVTTAKLARAHNNANIMAIGERIVGYEVARECVKTFLLTPFDEGRHRDRIAKIDLTN